MGRPKEFDVSVNHNHMDQTTIALRLSHRVDAGMAQYVKERMEHELYKLQRDLMGQNMGRTDDYYETHQQRAIQQAMMQQQAQMSPYANQSMLNALSGGGLSAGQAVQSAPSPENKKPNKTLLLCGV